ncbi:hypothetical protein DFJ58DRAFT_847048 [Suillus subalutaceus]|uniref:uncharacterized protein n=1 Tax=Suillus subalutaceus TaxID=48586 RepID=UPI001B87AA98|nr:uncharacterized protein DFJ58DRAFT_847048 [Suillus subalutaceus]KAG1836281.1 hypothetical protein DFJ58DRAFT_847048 [Suillus subalutaceus]
MFYQCRLRAPSDTHYFGLWSWTRPAAELLDLLSLTSPLHFPRSRPPHDVSVRKERPAGHIEKERIEANTDLAANWMVLVSLSHQYAVHQGFATGTFAISSGQYSVLTNLFHSTKTNLTVRSTSNDKVCAPGVNPDAFSMKSRTLPRVGTYLTALRTNSQYGLLGVVKLDVGHGGVLFGRHHIGSNPKVAASQVIMILVGTAIAITRSFVP